MKLGSKTKWVWFVACRFKKLVSGLLLIRILFLPLPLHYRNRTQWTEGAFHQLHHGHIIIDGWRPNHPIFRPIHTQPRFYSKRSCLGLKKDRNVYSRWRMLSDLHCESPWLRKSGYKNLPLAHARSTVLSLRSFPLRSFIGCSLAGRYPPSRDWRIVLDAIFRQPQRSVVSNGAEAGFRGLQQQMSGERLKLANYLGLRVFFPTLAAKCRKLVSRYVRPMGILSAFSLFRAADMRSWLVSMLRLWLLQAFYMRSGINFIARINR